VSRFIYLSRCYYKIYSFSLVIKVALLASRCSPALGDWCADQLGITAAYRRGRAVLELPVRGNVS
jgi:hypothetical protein